jgi:hypothetical protein
MTYFALNVFHSPFKYSVNTERYGEKLLCVLFAFARNWMSTWYNSSVNVEETRNLFTGSDQNNQ